MQSPDEVHTNNLIGYLGAAWPSMVDGPLYQQEQVERTINQVARPWAQGRKAAQEAKAREVRGAPLGDLCWLPERVENLPALFEVEAGIR
jgi:hypothetical protein